MERSSGILLHISSLPSPHGIGTFGKAAYHFADFLHEAGQSYWQILPTCIAGAGGSPYQSISAFACNPYFIDMDILEDEGLLEKGEAARLCRTAKEDRLDMLSVAESRNILLSHAFQNADASLKKEAEEFAASQSWINDFALFCAAKEHFNEKAWTDWEDKNLRAHTHESIEKYNELLSDRIAYHKFLQFLCFKQWAKLKTYVNSLGIRIIGDIPIYVSSDSADVWAHQDEFLLDKDGRPSLVAGVPPDYFSKDGQLWGNPLYNWAEHKKTGYAWWISRIRQQLQLRPVSFQLSRHPLTPPSSRSSALPP